MTLIVIIAGCWKSDTPFTSETVEVKGDAAVYAALCRYWAKCYPDRLRFFSSGTVESCSEYYRCVLAKDRGSTNSLFVERDRCLDSINTAECDSDLSSVNPKPSASVLMTAAAANAGVSMPMFGLLDDISTHPACQAAGLTYGSTRIGDPCFLSSRQCEQGLYCKALPSRAMLGNRFCGICAQPAAIDEGCDESIRCEAGSWCVEGVCTSLLPLGAACALNSECDSLVCIAGSCVPPGKVNDPCDEKWDCETNYCSKDGLCSEPLLVGFGEPCEQRGVSVPSYCDPDLGLTCIERRCAPMADLGGACEWRRDCRLDLLCIGGVCRSGECPGVEGTYCDGVTSTCKNDAFCASETQTCTRRKPLAKRCLDTYECAEGLICEKSLEETYGVCAPTRESGEPCSADSDCTSFYCDKSPWECEIVIPDGVNCYGPRCDNCGTCALPPALSACPSL
jgi:hypothetical protein